MTSKCRCPLGQMIVVRHSASSITISAQIFAGVEREGCRITKCSYDLALVLSSVRLGGIFDDPEIVLSSDGHDGIHVGRLTIKVDWDNTDSFRCDLGFNQGWIDRESLVIGVAEDDATTSLGDRLRSRNPGMGRGDNFVARFHP